MQEIVFPDSDNFRAYLQDNLLTSVQVSELLGVSKQAIGDYVKKGKLRPAVVTSQGALFFKKEIDSFINGSIDVQTKDVLSCRQSTRRCVSFFEDHFSEFDEFVYVFVCFDEYDAIMKQFVDVTRTIFSNDLEYLSPYTFCARDKFGKEIRLASCNCGYGGEGPHGTESILKSLGVPEDLRNNIFNTSCGTAIFYRADIDEPWELKLTPQRTPLLKSISGRLYRRNGKLVLLGESNAFFTAYDIEPSGFLSAFIDFAPAPIEIKILSNEEALNAGYYVVDWDHYYCYNLIIKDESEREIWLHTDVDVESIKMTPLSKILNDCGYEVHEKWYNAFPERVRSWLGLVIKQTIIKK